MPHFSSSTLYTQRVVWHYGVTLGWLLRPPGKRNKIVVERRCFPSDEYAVQSVVQQHGLDPEEAILYIDRRSGEEQWRTEDIVQVIEEHVRTPHARKRFGTTPYSCSALFSGAEMLRVCVRAKQLRS